MSDCASWRRWPTPLAALAACLAVTVAAAGCAGAPASGAPRTLVETFHPAMPAGPAQTGRCWTQSIAVERTGAWRCMVGNFIYDPCFSVAGYRGSVVCGANPANEKPGFPLLLTQKLPPRGRTPPSQRPWLVKLRSGAMCSLDTGTITVVDGLGVPYGCSDSRRCDRGRCSFLTGLTMNFTRGPVWLADRIAYRVARDGRKTILSRRRVPVAATWK